MLSDAEILSESLRRGLINWYCFNHSSSVLYIGSDINIMEELKSNTSCSVSIIDIENINDLFCIENKNVFDYVVIISDLEKCSDPTEILCKIKQFVKPEGHFLIGLNNRLGLRYFCGDRDIYTGHSFDGIDGYRKSYADKNDKFTGRTYDQSEIKNMLKKSGWERFKFYSVISDLDNPYILLAEDYLPNEDLSNRVFPTYNHPDSVFLEEETLYRSLINNGMFHKMANAYFIDCSQTGELSDVEFVTNSMERGRESALTTVIHNNGVVEKKAVYEEGKKRLKNIKNNLDDISSKGLRVVDAVIENDVLKMPYVKAEVGQLYLKNLIYSDKEKFICEMDRFRELLFRSSDIVSEDKGDGEGSVFSRGYIDLVPLNSFYVDGEFVFYDQEFCEENYPANALVWRMIATFYSGNSDFHNIVPIEFFIDRYNLNQKLSKWQNLEWNFLSELRNEKTLRIYHEECRRNIETVNSNRQRLNYSETEYKRLFVNIFDKIGDRKIILFGSGNFTMRFIDMYGKEYPIYAIIDNNNEKWGQRLEGIEIISPDVLKDISEDDYKIIICIKKYSSVEKQLNEMGFRNYSIFDSGRSYTKHQEMFISQDNKKKKYHTGYVAGVFDMFHVGHLNILKKAKEQCDYLIVGVVPDAGVFEQKNKYPVIPCDERVEIVQGCRYVDRAEALPLKCRSIRDAYKMYEFDCMFTGTDYVDNPDWLADKEYLRKNGSDIVFFPYTEKTSSTKIREKLKINEEI